MLRQIKLTVVLLNVISSDVFEIGDIDKWASNSLQSPEFPVISSEPLTDL